MGIILLIAVLDGYRRGVVKLLGSFGGLLISFFLAQPLTSWFLAGYPVNRLVEIAVFIIITAAITWLVHFAMGFFGSVVNHTPLIGFISRMLGVCAEFFIFTMMLYLIHVYLLPWLVNILPQAAPFNKIFDSSGFVLPVIMDIGSLVWHTTVQAITTGVS